MSVRPPSSCRRLAPLVASHPDGELDAAQIATVESHVTECAGCREELALRSALRASLRDGSPKAPPSLREKLQKRLADERERADKGTLVPAPAATVTPLPHVRPARTTPPRSRLRARHMVPFVAAAAAAFVYAMQSGKPAGEETASPAGTPSLYNPKAVVQLDGILDDLVSLHKTPLPPEVTVQDEVRKFDPFVGVPVEPPKLQVFGAKWLGGRVLPIRDSRAAMLQYAMGGGQRVTVYVYDPKRVKQESRTLLPKTVRNLPVLVGNVGGVNVAAVERRGVGYAVATDLGEPESVELAAASE